MTIQQRTGSYRNTAQRKLLQELLNRGDFLSAAELLERAREKIPGINLSTVYRNLRFFSAQGILTRRQRGVNTVFALRTKWHRDSVYMICNRCGKIYDYQTGIPKSFEKRLLQERPCCRIIGMDIKIDGYCPCCGCIQETDKFENTEDMDGK